MAFRSFVDMRRTPEEKGEEVAERMGMSTMDISDYPPGLSFCLDETDLEKLDIEDDCEVGDLIHVAVMARVTSVSKRQVNGQEKCRVELQGEQVSIENETTETPDED
jgi:hypothetical protein